MKDVQNVQKRGRNRERCGDQVDSSCILAGPFVTFLRTKGWGQAETRAGIH